MLAELRNSLRPALILLVALTLLTGILYPLAVTGAAQLVFPHQANGSLIQRQGRVVGSELIGQNFAGAGYFHGRPSAAGKDGYDGAGSAGSNLAPGSRDLRDAIAKRMADLRAANPKAAIPADLVTASASGLDPDISPEAALFQVQLIAAKRGLAPGALANLVARDTHGALLGFLGEPRVNVLELNLELDAMEAATRR